MVTLTPRVLRALTPACVPVETRIRMLFLLLVFEFAFLCMGMSALDSLGVLAVVSVLASPSSVAASLGSAVLAFATSVIGAQPKGEVWA